jgi:GTP cyclohydrolase I
MGVFEEAYLVAAACACEAEESDDIGLLAGDVAVASYAMELGGARAAAGARRGRPP